MDEVTLKRLRQAAMAAQGASMVVPSPFGDVLGLGGDALSAVANPDERTWTNAGMAAASLLPGIPSTGARKMGGRVIEALKKDVPPFEDQMKLARVVMAGHHREKKLDHLFDAKNGIGQVPNNEDVAHLGSVHYMTPGEYLDLAEPLVKGSQKSFDYIKEGLAKGKKLGQPTLNLDLVDRVPTVVNHDGRHRVTVLKELYGDNVKIPVHVFAPRNLKTLPEKFPPSTWAPQRERDQEFAALLKRANDFLQQHKDKAIK